MVAWIQPAWGGTLVETHLYAKNTEQAILSAESAAVAAPGDIDAQEIYIDVLMSSGLGSRAQRIYRDRVGSNPTNANAQYLLGRASVSGADAAISYERALRIDPDHARSHMGMGAVYTAKGAHPDAARAYFRSVNLDPSLSEAWLGLIRAELAMGLIEDAQSLAKKGLRHVPEEPGLYLLIAELDPSDASRVLSGAVGRGIDDPRVLSALAGALLEDGDADRAVVTARHALAIDRSNADATQVALFAAAVTSGTLDIDGYRGLGAARDRQRTDKAAALSLFDGLVAKYPKCALTWLGRSQLRVELGDTAGALSDSASAARLAPGNTEIEAGHGMLLLSAEHFGDAAPYLMRASEARPWDASLSLAFARALDETDRDADALKVLEVVHGMHPFDPRVTVAYGQLLVDNGRAEEAYQLIRKSMERVPDPRLGVALVMVATAAERYGEAAQILERLAAQTGRKSLAEHAARLREREQAK
jgi:tetratricopeptide (TPR) repeat protein